MLIDVLQKINEAQKGEKSVPSIGRHVKARKSRVKVYDSIKDALNSAAPYGTIFSTKAADRLYVISKPTWGDKSRAGGNTRIAKGFTPGSATPSASWPSIKSHAVRTMLKHGKSTSKQLRGKHGPGKSRPAEKRHAGKKTQNDSTQYEGISLHERRVAKMQHLRESTSAQNWELFREQVETLSELLPALAAIPAMIGKGIAGAASLAAKGVGAVGRGVGSIAAKGAGVAAKGIGGAAKLARRGAQAAGRGLQTVGRTVGKGVKSPSGGLQKALKSSLGQTKKPEVLKYSARIPRGNIKTGQRQRQGGEPEGIAPPEVEIHT